MRGNWIWKTKMYGDIANRKNIKKIIQNLGFWNWNKIKVVSLWKLNYLSKIERKRARIKINWIKNKRA